LVYGLECEVSRQRGGRFGIEENHQVNHNESI
jgi:hypothetical protein